MIIKRTTLGDVARSRIPAVVGLCAADIPGIASIVNEAQSQLIKAGGDTGWYGSWVKVVFNVSRTNPYITLPRTLARIVDADVCRSPIRVENEWLEFLEYGEGLQRPPPDCASVKCTCGMQMYDRGTVPTAYDFVPGNKLRFYLVNQLDSGKRVFIAGAKDTNNMPVYTMDRGVNCSGFFATLDNQFPFIESNLALNEFSGIQKDQTLGPIMIYQVNPVTDATSFLTMLEPSETNAVYRRYYIQGLPDRCCDCDAPNGTAQVTAMAKLEFIPAQVETDYLIINDLDALKSECQSVRYSEMDTPNAAQLSAIRHREAITHLNNELKHYFGTERPAFNFAPFGYETLARAGVGMI